MCESQEEFNEDPGWGGFLDSLSSRHLNESIATVSSTMKDEEISESPGKENVQCEVNCGIPNKGTPPQSRVMSLEENEINLNEPVASVTSTQLHEETKPIGENSNSSDKEEYKNEVNCNILIGGTSPQSRHICLKENEINSNESMAAIISTMFIGEHSNSSDKEEFQNEDNCSITFQRTSPQSRIIPLEEFCPGHDINIKELMASMISTILQGGTIANEGTSKPSNDAELQSENNCIIPFQEISLQSSDTLVEKLWQNKESNSTEPMGLTNSTIPQVETIPNNETPKLSNNEKSQNNEKLSNRETLKLLNNEVLEIEDKHSIPIQGIPLQSRLTAIEDIFPDEYDNLNETVSTISHQNTPMSSKIGESQRKINYSTPLQRTPMQNRVTFPNTSCTHDNEKYTDSVLFSPCSRCASVLRNLYSLGTPGLSDPEMAVASYSDSSWEETETHDPIIPTVEGNNSPAASRSLHQNSLLHSRDSCQKLSPVMQIQSEAIERSNFCNLPMDTQIIEPSQGFLEKDPLKETVDDSTILETGEDTVEKLKTNAPPRKMYNLATGEVSPIMQIQSDAIERSNFGDLPMETQIIEPSQGFLEKDPLKETVDDSTISETGKDTVEKLKTNAPPRKMYNFATGELSPIIQIQSDAIKRSNFGNLPMETQIIEPSQGFLEKDPLKETIDDSTIIETGGDTVEKLNTNTPPRKTHNLSTDSILHSEKSSPIMQIQSDVTKRSNSGNLPMETQIIQASQGSVKRSSSEGRDENCQDSSLSSKKLKLCDADETFDPVCYEQIREDPKTILNELPKSSYETRSQSMIADPGDFLQAGNVNTTEEKEYIAQANISTTNLVNSNVVEALKMFIMSASKLKIPPGLPNESTQQTEQSGSQDSWLFEYRRCINSTQMKIESTATEVESCSSSQIATCEQNDSEATQSCFDSKNTSDDEMISNLDLTQFTPLTNSKKESETENIEQADAVNKNCTADENTSAMKDVISNENNCMDTDEEKVALTENRPGNRDTNANTNCEDFFNAETEATNTVNNEKDFMDTNEENAVLSAKSSENLGARAIANCTDFIDPIFPTRTEVESIECVAETEIRNAEGIENDLMETNEESEILVEITPENTETNAVTNYAEFFDPNFPTCTQLENIEREAQNKSNYAAVNEEDAMHTIKENAVQTKSTSEQTDSNVVTNCAELYDPDFPTCTQLENIEREAQSKRNYAAVNEEDFMDTIKKKAAYTKSTEFFDPDFPTCTQLENIERDAQSKTNLAGVNEDDSMHTSKENAVLTKNIPTNTEKNVAKNCGQFFDPNYLTRSQLVTGEHEIPTKIGQRMSTTSTSEVSKKVSGSLVSIDPGLFYQGHNKSRLSTTERIAVNDISPSIAREPNYEGIRALSLRRSQVMEIGRTINQLSLYVRDIGKALAERNIASSTSPELQHPLEQGQSSTQLKSNRFFSNNNRESATHSNACEFFSPEERLGQQNYKEMPVFNAPTNVHNLASDLRRPLNPIRSNFIQGISNSLLPNDRNNTDRSTRLNTGQFFNPEQLVRQQHDKETVELKEPTTLNRNPLLPYNSHKIYINKGDFFDPTQFVGQQNRKETMEFKAPTTLNRNPLLSHNNHEIRINRGDFYDPAQCVGQQNRKETMEFKAPTTLNRNTFLPHNSHEIRINRGDFFDPPQCIGQQNREESVEFKAPTTLNRNPLLPHSSHEIRINRGEFFDPAQCVGQQNREESVEFKAPTALNRNPLLPHNSHEIRINRGDFFDPAQCVGQQNREESVEFKAPTTLNRNPLFPHNSHEIRINRGDFYDPA